MAWVGNHSTWPWAGIQSFSSEAFPQPEMSSIWSLPCFSRLTDKLTKWQAYSLDLESRFLCVYNILAPRVWKCSFSSCVYQFWKRKQNEKQSKQTKNPEDLMHSTEVKLQLFSWHNYVSPFINRAQILARFSEMLGSLHWDFKFRIPEGNCNEITRQSLPTKETICLPVKV